MNRSTSSSRRRLAALAAALLLAGCASLDAAAPPPAGATPAAQWRAAPLPTATPAPSCATGGSSSRPAADAPDRRRANRQPTLADARARIEQARAARVVGGAALTPTLSANASATRGKLDLATPVGTSLGATCRPPGRSTCSAPTAPAAMRRKPAWTVRASRNGTTRASRWPPRRLRPTSRCAPARPARAERTRRRLARRDRAPHRARQAGFQSPPAPTGPRQRRAGQRHADAAARRLRSRGEGAGGAHPLPSRAAHAAAGGRASLPPAGAARRRAGAVPRCWRSARPRHRRGANWSPAPPMPPGTRAALAARLAGRQHRPVALRERRRQQERHAGSVGPVSVSLPIFDGGARRANAQAAQAAYDAAATRYAARLQAVREVEEALVALQSTGGTRRRRAQRRRRLRAQPARRRVRLPRRPGQPVRAGRRTPHGRGGPVRADRTAARARRRLDLAVPRPRRRLECRRRRSAHLTRHEQEHHHAQLPTPPARRHADRRRAGRPRRHRRRAPADKPPPPPRPAGAHRHRHQPAAGQRCR